MARISYDDDTFSDLTPEEFQRVKAFSDRMLKEAFAQKGKGYRVQVGTLFGCPIYLDESVPDGEFELEAAAWNRRAASVTETMMAQRRLLADGVMSEREGYGLPAEVVVLARSIVYDEPAPAGDERREVGEEAIAVCEMLNNMWGTAPATDNLLAVMQCAASVVERARQLQERDDD